MSTSHTTIHRAGAFTIMELIVAIAIAMLLGFLVNQLFFSTSRAVQIGMRTGDMLVTSESIGEQLRRDARRMLGPDADAAGVNHVPAGFLVIVNRSVPNAPVMFDGYERLESDLYGTNWPAVRSDMLVFFAQGSANEGTLHASMPRQDDRLENDLQSQYARIWYGHVARTNPDGTYGGALGEPDRMNAVASDWMLGRHQLLLNPDDLDINNDIHAEFADWGNPVSGVSDAPAGVSLLRHGLTDVTGEPLTGVGGILDWIATSGDPPAHRYERLFLSASGGRIEQMWANPTPSPMTFESWQMAQTHPILASHVSDFIVEFAGDYEDESGALGPDGKIDRESGPGSPIKWYTHPAFANVPSTPEYDHRRPATYVPPDRSGATGPGFTTDPLHAEGPYEIAVDDDQGISGNAHYYLFRHDEPDTWPYLIRIRYRMHDPRGLIRDSLIDSGSGASEPQSGRWFEHVIAVPRPHP